RRDSVAEDFSTPRRQPAGPPDDPDDDGDYSDASSSYDTADDGADAPGEERGERLLRAATITIEEMGRYLYHLRLQPSALPGMYPSQQHLPLPGPRPAVRATKLKDPDTFNGEDPSKLQSFLLQCGLHFVQHPTDFPQDDDKIIYVMSYLRGPATEWF
ncbi:hypothetical protein EUX98_g8203, partial [Antrodiella citrinella]